jgi:Hormone-sensitive lipase (HSL) N-terminus
MVDVFENTEVSFGFNLTNLAETKIFSIFQHFSEHKISVNEVFVIPTESLKIYSEKHGKLIDIPVPSSHIDEKPIYCRLFSSCRREGMVRYEKIDEF